MVGFVKFILKGVNMKKLTDKEFEKIWKEQKKKTKNLIDFLGQNALTICINNVNNIYHITSLEDIWAVYEQELYHKLTGRQ